MKFLVTLSILIMAFAVLHVPAAAAPSELVGIYTIVERVVLEPDDRNPQRIQLWGAFATNRTRANPQKGYMYFMLPNSQRAAALKEWSDFKNLAGTGRVVSFGTSFFSSAQPVRRRCPLLRRFRTREKRIRKTSVSGCLSAQPWVKHHLGFGSECRSPESAEGSVGITPASYRTRGRESHRRREAICLPSSWTHHRMQSN